MAQTVVSQVGPPLLARPEGLTGEIPEIIDNANKLLASAVTVLNWQAGEAVVDYPDPASSELPVKSLQLQVQAAGRALAAYRGQVAALSEKISAVQSGGRLSALQVGDAQAPLATHLPCARPSRTVRAALRSAPHVRRKSRARTRMRRSQWKATAPQLVPINVAGLTHHVPPWLIPAVRRGLVDLDRQAWPC